MTDIKQKLAQFCTDCTGDTRFARDPVSYRCYRLSKLSRSKMRAVIVAALTVLLCGCEYLEDDVARSHDRSLTFTTPSAFMTADARIVTQRRHPVTGQTVVCVEPSPDAVKAIASSGAAGIKGGNGAITGGIDLSGSIGEAAGELAGRSTALLGLREGLFRACEAYANGIIGADAYGLILAKYAPTMMTMFLAQDISGAAGAARAALSINASAPNTLPADNGDAPAQKHASASHAAAELGAAIPRLWPAAMVTPVKQQSGHTTKKSSKPSADAAQGDPEQAPGSSSSDAWALVRMNEDYMLQPTLISTLLVACIEQNDPTRYTALLSDSSHQQSTNKFLARLCDDIKNIDDVVTLSEKITASAKDLRLVEPGGSSGKGAKPSGK